MGILRWFDSREAVRFAKTIAQEIYSVSPPESKSEPRSAPRVKDIKKMEKTFLRIYNFSREQELNIYTKAKFLNVLRWELKEYQYPSSYIDHLLGIIAPKL
jgi:hypothetical protein